MMNDSTGQSDTDKLAAHIHHAIAAITRTMWICTSGLMLAAMLVASVSGDGQGEGDEIRAMTFGSGTLICTV